MPYPVAVVEIAFTDGPYVVSPTWTDVTAYVRGMDISRGIPDDWTLQADGSATVTLSNRDRRFDPFNTTGPYYGNLLPRRQIRIRATHASTTYDVFRGFIAGWPPEWTDAGTDSTVTLFCFDALQLLGSSSLPADWSRDYILSQSPRHYYPCDEPVTPYTGTSTLKDYGSIPLNITASATAINGGELAPGLPGNSIQAAVSSAGTSGFATTAANTDFSVSMWAVMDSTSATTGGAVGAYGWAIGWDPNTGQYVVTIQDQAAGLTRTYTSSNTYDGSQPSHVTFSFNVTSKALVLMVDGVIGATTSATAGAIIIIVGENVALGTGQFQQVCVWTGLIAQATVQEIIRRSKAVFPETTSARFNRIIAETPFSASLTSVPASPASSVLDITNDAPTAVSELGKVAVSEYAPLFVNKAGTVTMYSQSQIRSQTKSIVPQAEYGNGVGFMGNSIGTEVQLQYDGDSMRNVSNVQMSGGGVYIQTNSSSVTTYGEAEQYVETQVASLADAVDIANIVNGWGGNVYAKASPVSVVLSPSASWASTLGLELFDRFTLQVTPPSGNAITTPMLASRIAHSVTPERWVTTLEGSARWAAVFILNQSRLGGTDLLG
jgi:hypothetical protein